MESNYQTLSHDGWTRRHYETVASTNDLARIWARDDAPSWSCVTASSQSAGRGRRGRDWISVANCGVYLSAIVRPSSVENGDEAAIAMATMIAALAALRAAEEVAHLRASLKWPNDVLLRGRKISGVLCESEWRDGKLAALIIGIGLNVNQRVEDLPERAIFPASSLRIESGREFDVESVTRVVLRELRTLWQGFQNGDGQLIRAAWESRCEGLGSLISVTNEGRKTFGILRGLDETGALLLMTTDGLKRVLAGDLSFD